MRTLIGDRAGSGLGHEDADWGQGSDNPQGKGPSERPQEECFIVGVEVGVVVGAWAGRYWETCTCQPASVGNVPCAQQARHCS